MATERLSMRTLREILRQKWALARSHRQVAASLQVSVGTVTSVLRRATHAGLDWPQVQAVSDDVLEARLYGAPAPPAGDPAAARIVPTSTPSGRSPASPWNCSTWSTSSSTPPATATPGSATSTASGSPGTGSRCARSTAPARRSSSITPGRSRHLVDPTTGEAITEVELFVGVLGASNYTYAEATYTQQLPDWLGSHTRMFAFFGGVSAAVVCDFVPGNKIAASVPSPVMWPRRPEGHGDAGCRGNEAT